MKEFKFEIRKGFINELTEFEGLIVPMLKIKTSI